MATNPNSQGHINDDDDDVDDGDDDGDDGDGDDDGDDDDDDISMKPTTGAERNALFFYKRWSGIVICLTAYPNSVTHRNQPRCGPLDWEISLGSFRPDSSDSCLLK